MFPPDRTRDALSSLVRGDRVTVIGVHGSATIVGFDDLPSGTYTQLRPDEGPAYRVPIADVVRVPGNINPVLREDIEGLDHESLLEEYTNLIDKTSTTPLDRRLIREIRKEVLRRMGS